MKLHTKLFFLGPVITILSGLAMGAETLAIAIIGWVFFPLGVGITIVAFISHHYSKKDKA